MEDEPKPIEEFNLRNAENRRRREREKRAHFSYTDEFAPSSIQIPTMPREFEDDPTVRLAIYGGDIFAQINQAAFAASALGLLPVFILPSRTIKLLEDRDSCLKKIESLAKSIDEQSPEWVALAVYSRLVKLSDWTLDIAVREHSLLILGSLSAQYASMIQNKEYTTKHRERIRFASAGGRNRALSVEEHQERKRVFEKHRETMRTDTRAAEKTIEELGLKSMKTGERLKPNSFLRSLREYKKRDD